MVLPVYFILLNNREILSIVSLKTTYVGLNEMPSLRQLTAVLEPSRRDARKMSEYLRAKSGPFERESIFHKITSATSPWADQSRKILAYLHRHWAFVAGARLEARAWGRRKKTSSKHSAA